MGDRSRRDRVRHRRSGVHLHPSCIKSRRSSGMGPKSVGTQRHAADARATTWSSRGGLCARGILLRACQPPVQGRVIGRAVATVAVFVGARRCWSEIYQAQSLPQDARFGAGSVSWKLLGGARLRERARASCPTPNLPHEGWKSSPPTPRSASWGNEGSATDGVACRASSSCPNVVADDFPRRRHAARL